MRSGSIIKSVANVARTILPSPMMIQMECIAASRLLRLLERATTSRARGAQSFVSGVKKRRSSVKLFIRLCWNTATRKSLLKKNTKSTRPMLKPLRSWREMSMTLLIMILRMKMEELVLWLRLHLGTC